MAQINRPVYLTQWLAAVCVKTIGGCAITSIIYRNGC